MIQSIRRHQASGTLGMMTAASIWGTWVLILSLVSLPGIYVTPVAFTASTLGLLVLTLASRTMPAFLQGLRDRAFMRQVALTALLEAIQFSMYIISFSLAIASGSSVVIPIIRSLSGVVTPLLAVVSVIFRGIYYLKQRQVAQLMQAGDHSPVHVLTYHCGIAALILLPVVILYRLIDPQPVFAILLPQLLFIGIFGLTHGAFGALLRLRAMQHLNAQQSIVIMYLEPVTSVTLSILFLGEIVTPSFFVGATLVLLAAWVASRKKRT